MKYIDMYTAFKGDETFDMTETELIGAKVAFQWIDHNLEQVPGRTITEGELHSALRDYNAALYTEIDTANRLGLLVAPDSEADRNTTKEEA